MKKAALRGGRDERRIDADDYDTLARPHGCEMPRQRQQRTKAFIVFAGYHAARTPNNDKS